LELLSWVLLSAAALGVWPGDGGGVARTGFTPLVGQISLQSVCAVKVGRSVFESPIVVGEYLVAWSGRGEVKTWRLPDLDEVWGEKWGRAPVACWAERNLLVVCAGHPGNLVLGVDLQTGETRWKVKDLDPSCPPLVADRVAVVGTSAGELVALRLVDGHQIWRIPVSSGSLSGIAMDEGSILATALDGELVRVTDGAVAWRRPLSGNCYGGPSVSDGLAVCTTSQGDVHAVDRGGATVWTRRTGERLRSRACLGAGVVLVTSSEGVVRAFRTADGKALWSTPLDGLLTAAPSLVGTTAVVGSSQGTGWLLDSRTGAVIDTLQVRGPLTSQAAVGSGLLVWGTGEGRAHVWRLTRGASPASLSE
jgi:outer membrane protein assembly factor BamB